MNIFLDGKRFRSVSNTPNGEVGAETVFTYHQSGNIVTAEYSGGSIVVGHLLAVMSDDGVLTMRYHHVNQSGELMVGECVSTPEVLRDGRLKFHERWRWLSGDGSEGCSEIEEIPEFGAAVPGVTYVLRPGGYVLARNSEGAFAVVATPRGFFLPGGGRNTGESAAEAARREAMEECGLDARIGDLIGIADELVFAEAEGAYFRKRCAFFLGELVGASVSTEPDHRLVWIPPAEAADRLTHHSQRWAIKAVG